MIVTVEWDGTNRPFEGEISIPVEVIPAGAKIESARVEVTPVDPGNSFVETISFGAAGPRWGANKVQGPRFVEVDFRGRRTLAAIRGSGLAGTTLQIDPGGAYMEINDRGAIRSPGDSLFTLAGDAAVLPAFVAARVKLTGPAGSAPDLSAVDVRSVPENVSLRLGGNPPFHTFTGPLTAPATSIDFAVLLEEFLAGAEVQNGYFAVPLVVHSDTIARLRLNLTLDVLEAQTALPDGVSESVLSFSFNAIPAGAAASLPLSLPAGARIVAGQTSVRLLGSFDDTRIAFGPVVPVQSGQEAEISSEPGRPQAQAQQFRLPQDLAISGIDLLLRATSAAAQVRVDLRDDLGGKPGLNSLLAAALTIDLSAKPSGQAEWASIALPAELKLNADRPYWLTVQRSLGNAAWSATAAAGLPLQQTKDGGLSWRQSEAAAAEGYFRLRHRPERFTMPVHVFVGEGEQAEEVPLARYESLGRVDFTLDTQEFADTIDRVLAASAASACLPAEHLDNGEFHDWLRIGDAPGEPRSVGGGLAPRAAAFSRDGKVLYVLAQAAGVRLHAIDPICRDEVTALPLPESGITPSSFGSALAVTADGRKLAAHLNGRTWLVDLESMTLIGHSDDQRLATNFMAAGGSSIYLIRGVSNTAGFSIERVNVESLERHVTSGAELSVELFAGLEVGVSPAGLAASAGGEQLYLAATVPAAADATRAGRFVRVYETANPGAPPRTLPLAFTPSGIALHPEESVAYIGEADTAAVHMLDTVSGAPRGRLSPASGSITGLSMPALSPAYLTALVELPTEARSLDLFEFGIPVPEAWQLTSGQVSPKCIEDPFRIAAFLGGRAAIDSPASSISQVVAVSAGCPYEFSFWGVAEADGAAGEVIWRVSGCGSPRRDTIPIEVIERTGAALNRKAVPAGEALRFHRLRVNAPEGAIAAEVRFRTTLGVRAIVDRVSLRTVSPVLANADFLEFAAGAPKSWTVVPAAPAGFALTVTEEGVEFVNNGLETVAVFQQIQVAPGTVLRVEFSGEARTAGDVPFLHIDWQAAGAAPGVVLLDPAAPRLRIASLTVPENAGTAEFSIQTPPGSEVKMESLRVEPDVRVSVPINVYAEAPGELSLLDIRVVTDRRPPTPPPAPAGGLCPPTKPGQHPGKEECHYCPCCKGDHAGARPRPVVTPSRRPAVQVTCANCGTAVVRPVTLSRAELARAPAPASRLAAARPLVMLRQPARKLKGQAVPARPTAATAATAWLAPVSLKAVLGLQRAEREKLEASELGSLHALAGASPARVAAVLGEASIRRAESLIARARRLLLDTGR